MSCIFVNRTEKSSDTSGNFSVLAGCVESLIKGFVAAENKKLKLLLSPVQCRVLSTKCVKTGHEGFPGQTWEYTDLS